MAKKLTPAQAAKRRRRRLLQTRQTLFFGVLITLVALAGITATMIYTGQADSPFARPISSPSPSPEPVRADEPCVPDGTLPVPYNQVLLEVQNSTNQVGLAGGAAETLLLRGFTVSGTGNTESITGTPARILFGSNGVAQAYTLAAHMVDVELVLDTRTGSDITLVLSTGYNGLTPLDQVDLAPDTDLPPRPGCLPMDQIDPVPGPVVDPGTDEGEGEPETDYDEEGILEEEDTLPEGGED